MLTKVPSSGTRSAGARFAIVASRYNHRFVEPMVRAARQRLLQAGADGVKIVRVPGAFEIPVAVSHLVHANPPTWAAVLCLGVIIRGQTEHARLIGEAVTQALCQMQVASGVPVIHEVLLLDSIDQAKVRCLDVHHNRGREAAETALAMARLIRLLRAESVEALRLKSKSPESSRKSERR